MFYRTGRFAFGVILLAAGWVLSAPPAHAQINPFGRRDVTSLDKEDLRLGREAAEKLLTDPSAHLGAVETWNNPKTGNSGRIDLVKTFNRSGMPCKTLKSLFHFQKQPAKDSTYTFNVCKIASGEWKIV